MCPDNTAGTDGFTSHFYQSCWDIIAEDLMGAVLDFFSGTSPPKNFTTATIILIPKIENPETWKDFRPISLCNVSRKILSKIMNNQVAVVLPKCISPSQSGFVQGHMIANNILLAQELVHCLGVNGSKNNAIFKLDMAKAYDRLNWNFLYRMVHRIGFPMQWIAKECLSRGLNNLFEQHPRLQYFTRCSLHVSHLAFANDVIIFSKGNRKELTILMEFLQRFGNQKIMIWSSWDSVCYPTEEGGFGIRKLDDVVEAFQHKLWWRFRIQLALWSHFLLDKYCKGTHPTMAKPSYIALPIGNVFVTLGKKQNLTSSGALEKGKSHSGLTIGWGRKHFGSF
ncbi:UNVERIFIED_CONTAM: hypothetical protein Sindi_0930000 [Sesamum indicum]